MNRFQRNIFYRRGIQSVFAKEYRRDYHYAFAFNFAVKNYRTSIEHRKRINTHIVYIFYVSLSLCSLCGKKLNHNSRIAFGLLRALCGKKILNHSR